MIDIRVEELMQESNQNNELSEDNPSTEQVDALPTLEELVKQAELKATEHQEAWLRAKAETENVRKRAQTDIANAHKYAVENFATGLVSVRDSLEAALATENTNLETLRNGVELTLKQLNAVFEKSKLVEIDPINQKFDPNRHQTISAIESDAPANTIVQVLQKGYLLHDRIIRPALVVVSKSKEA